MKKLFLLLTMGAVVFVAADVKAAAIDVAKVTKELANAEENVLQKLTDWYAVNQAFVVDAPATQSMFIQLVGLLRAEVARKQAEEIFNFVIQDTFRKDLGGVGAVQYSLDFSPKALAHLKDERELNEGYLIRAGKVAPATLKSFSDLVWSLEALDHLRVLVPALRAFAESLRVAYHSSLAQASRDFEEVARKGERAAGSEPRK